MTVFEHRAFTGRSGTMFGFEGLGCIYWHMVSKLLLVVQEVYCAAVDQDAAGTATRRLGELYYRVRAGLGFNKTPAEYGAFPTDPYSHTPGHGGASQPGMTGQVKEEILTRFGELGVRVSGGRVHLQPTLLRPQEFLREPREFRYLDLDGAWQALEVPAGGLAFTWCQVPVVYRLTRDGAPGITLTLSDGATRHYTDATLDADDSASLFRRSGRIRQLTVTSTRTSCSRTDPARHNSCQISTSGKCPSPDSTSMACPSTICGRSSGRYSTPESTASASAPMSRARAPAIR
jgi:hypothetical protein